MSYLEKLLDGARVEWLELGEVATLQRGTSITKKDIATGEIPVIAGGQRPAYFHNQSNRDGRTIVIAGSGAYAGFVSYWEKPIFVSDAFSIKSNSEILLTKYCFYWLQTLQSNLYELQRGGGVPHVYAKDVGLFKIPIPCPDEPEKSLKIQGEIVAVLDKFSDLVCELKRELRLRKQQYAHYRDKLLTFSPDEAQWKTLGEIVETITAPTRLKKEDYCLTGSIPIIDQGIEFITGYTDKDVKLVPFDKYVIFGDHSEHVKYVDFAFVQGADGLKILRPIYDNAKYIYYALQNFYKKQKNYKRHWSAAKETLVPVPPLEKQKRIVAILDKFETLTHSIQEGLPREIALRQKHYEYTRDLLLNFPKDRKVTA